MAPNENIRSTVRKDVPVYKPRDLEQHILKEYSIAHVEPYINMQMLLGHHLGLKGKVAKLLAEKNEKAVQLKETIDGLILEAKEGDFLQPSAIYQFFPAQSKGDSVIIYDPNDVTKVIEIFTFPRQHKEPYLCLADYLRSVDSGEMDYVGFLAVTAGKNVRKYAEKFKEEGNFLLSHAVQSLALETAEALAERVHQLMRDQWGIIDSTDLSIQDLFAAKYQGQRYSFGYPSCPEIEDQAKLFKLIRPEQIGIQLTEGFMMEPEASVTAIVFAHPEARYFNVL